MTLTHWSALVAVLLVATVGDAVHADAITYRRHTTQRAAGQITGDDFDLDDFYNGLGEYNKTLTDSLSPEPGGTTRALASQQSSFPVGSSTIVPFGVLGMAQGLAEAQVSEADAISAIAFTNFQGYFEVTEPLTLRIRATLSATLDGRAFLGLGTAVGPSQTFLEELIDVGEDRTLTLDESFELGVGSYRLVADAKADGTPSLNSASFDVTFTVSEPAAIPLPAGVWGGTVALGGALAFARRCRF